jgi:hypothetical protein
MGLKEKILNLNKTKFFVPKNEVIGGVSPPIINDDIVKTLNNTENCYYNIFTLNNRPINSKFNIVSNACYSFIRHRQYQNNYVIIENCDVNFNINKLLKLFIIINSIFEELSIDYKITLLSYLKNNSKSSKYYYYSYLLSSENKNTLEFNQYKMSLLLLNLLRHLSHRSVDHYVISKNRHLFLKELDDILDVNDSYIEYLIKCIVNVNKSSNFSDDFGHSNITNTNTLKMVSKEKFIENYNKIDTLNMSFFFKN